MSKSHAKHLQEQVDEFLRAALLEQDVTVRRKLMETALYWHDAAAAAAASAGKARVQSPVVRPS